jgi:hypothetical protein
VTSLPRLALSEQSPRVRMQSPHEHGRTTCTYERVNEVNFRVIAQSSASGSSLKLFDLVSSPILANPVQSSPSIFWTESQRLSLSVAQWRSPIRMRNSYAHMTESAESISAFSSTSASVRSSLCLLTNSSVLWYPLNLRHLPQIIVLTQYASTTLEALLN